jgi:DNA (cytosine-5)-methyltransferase 1
MMMKNGKSCYVEIDPYAASWLRNLVSRGLIADGDVKECSVLDITPNDLADYSQVHLYAGIGVWSYSLRRAGIPDTANVWTFSEPCQPFSTAGKGLGFADDRYLRPYTNHLIEQCRPSICLGEQVASNDGLGWLDVVQTDMERARYACGALDTCSAGFGAPHIRQRLRVCAVAEEWLADTNTNRLAPPPVAGIHDAQHHVESRGGVERLADALVQQRPNGQSGISVEHHTSGWNEGAATVAGLRRNSWPGPTNGHWADADWLFCRDGKWRPVEPGTFPLAHGATSRVGRLRVYGNAVDAEATTDFCRNVGEVLGLI